jgi:predicted membrane metal-binding protein
MSSLPASITPAILDKILANLALLFLTAAGGDLPTARHAASRLLAAYDVATEEELRLAADIVSFGFHALDALGQSMAPDLSLKEILRLRGSAVSLNRQSHRSQRKLDQLRRDRPQQAQAAPPQETHEQAEVLAPETIRLTEPLNEPAPASRPAPSWPLANPQRLAAQQISDNLARNKAAHASRNAMRHTAPPAQSLQATG